MPDESRTGSDDPGLTESLIKQFQTIPEIRLAAEEFDSDKLTTILRDRLPPSLGNGFSEWEKTYGVTVLHDPDYRSWEPKEIIKSQVDIGQGRREYFAQPFYHNHDIKSLIDKAYNDSSLPDLLKKISTNALGQHLMRMLTHKDAPACANFVRICFVNADILPQNLKTVHRSLDGDGACQFYTLAPYIVDALVKLGRTERESLELLFVWSKSREISGPYNNDAGYPGIKFIHTRHLAFWLAYDGKDYSHRLAGKIGFELAKEILNISGSL